MDPASSGAGKAFRFRNILPRSGPPEHASKSAQFHVAALASPLPNFTNPIHFNVHGDAGATYIHGHTASQTFANHNLYRQDFSKHVETYFATGGPSQLLPRLEVEADQRDPSKFVPNIGIYPNASSYEGMMQLPIGDNSFANTQDPCRGLPFARGRETFPTAGAHVEFDGSQTYPNSTSRTMDVPLQSNQVWTNSLAFVDDPSEGLVEADLSFPEGTMPHGSTHQRMDVNATEDLWGLFGSHNNKNWRPFPSEIVEASVDTLVEPLEDRSADGDIDNFSMFFDTSTPTERLGPNLSAVLLGIPEDPVGVTRNEELSFGYETRPSKTYEDNSTGDTQSPKTLQASDSASSPPLTKASSHQSSVTLPVEQAIAAHGIESGESPSDGEETRSSTTLGETRRSLDLSYKEDEFSVPQPRLRTVLPLLPPPADFSHTNIVVRSPVVYSSEMVENYLKVATEAKQQGESKLANALPAPTGVPLTGSLMTQKRGRSPGEDPKDLSDHLTYKIMEEAESHVDMPSLTALSSVSVFSRKKRGTLSMQQRISAAKMRKIGACLRCGIFKEKCSDSIPCERCFEVTQSKQTSFIIPCWRSKLGDIELFRRRTQHGLFVYTYTKQSDGLHSRSVRIFDPEKLRQASRHRVPITCQEELTIESLRPLKYLDSHLLLPRNQNGCLLQYACTIEQLEKGKVITTYLDKQMKPVLNALGTSHQFVHLTLDIAERYSQSSDRKMLRRSLRIFTARFLRRKFWVSIPEGHSYEVAWMDVPWRAMPVLPPKTPAEAEILNKVLKDYLFGLEKSIIREFKAKVYARNRKDWFELFLVTFIFQVVLSEKLEMSFYSNVKGVDSALEMPWSTFGGLRSYSSQAIAAHFRAIKGHLPFQLSKRDRTALGKLGDHENSYLDACPNVLKDAMLKKDDLGSRRSSSSGYGGTPGSWWQWAIETVLDSDAPD